MSLDFHLGELLDYITSAKKRCIMTGENTDNHGQWGYEKMCLGFSNFSSTEIVKFKKNPVFVIHYSGRMMPEFGEDEIGEEEAYKLTRRVHNFLNQCMLKVEIHRPFRGPEEVNLRIPEFPDLQYSARIREDCLIEDGGGKRVNFDHFFGNDSVILRRDNTSSIIWEGCYLGNLIK